MRFKAEVNREGASPALWYRLPDVERVHFLFTGVELVVTSVRRSWGTVAHAPPPGELVRAADLRRWYLDELGRGVASAFVEALRRRLGPAFTVLLEPEDLREAEIEERGGLERIAPHIHFEVEEETFRPIVWF